MILLNLCMVFNDVDIYQAVTDVSYAVYRHSIIWIFNYDYLIFSFVRVNLQERLRNLP